MVTGYLNNKKCNCYTGETFRKELLESCGGTVLVGYCCCGDVRAVIGQLAMVGENFIILDEPVFIPVVLPTATPLPTAAAASAPTPTPTPINGGLEPAILIPLGRIFSFVETFQPPVEGACQGTCASDQTLLKHLAKEHCGQYVEVEICSCMNEGPVCIIGTLVEVGCDFIEIRAIDAVLCPGGPIIPGGFGAAIAYLKANNVSINQLPIAGFGDVVIRIENLCSVYVNPLTPVTI